MGETGKCRWVLANSEKCNGIAVDGSPVHGSDGEKLEPNSDWDFYKINKENKLQETTTCDAVDADVASTCLSLVQPSAECASPDDGVGSDMNLQDCMKACIRKPNCRYFIHGIRDKKDKCYIENPTNPKEEISAQMVGKVISTTFTN